MKGALSHGNTKQGFTHHLHLFPVLRRREREYSGDVSGNLDRACRYSRFAVDEGCVPITPHLYLPLFLSEETERELAIGLDLRLMDVCRELWVCGDVISDGMRREMAYAADIGIPIRHVKEEEIYVCN